MPSRQSSACYNPVVPKVGSQGQLVSADPANLLESVFELHNSSTMLKVLRVCDKNPYLKSPSKGS